jgi:hypothetical protein
LNIDGSFGVFGDIGSGGLLRDKKVNWIAGFSSNDGQGMHFLLSYLGFTMV